MLVAIAPVSIAEPSACALDSVVAADTGPTVADTRFRPAGLMVVAASNCWSLAHGVFAGLAFVAPGSRLVLPRVATAVLAGHPNELVVAADADPAPAPTTPNAHSSAATPRFRLGFIYVPLMERTLPLATMSPLPRS